MIRYSLLILTLYCSLYSQDIKGHFFSKNFSSLPLSSWEQPTTEDYLLIDQYIENKLKELKTTPLNLRPFKNDYLNKEFYGWIQYRYNHSTYAPEEIRGLHVDYLGNDPNVKDKCVICYVTYSEKNRDYIQGLKYLKKALLKIKFDGHFIYRIGGFPGLNRGRLIYADVPYSFKTFLFEEVKDMGYNQALWLDACCPPHKDLTPFFKHIQKKGIGFRSLGSMKWRPFVEGYQALMPEFNISRNKSYINQTNQVIGINFNSKIGDIFLKKMIELIKKKTPFLQSDDPPLSFLIHALKLENKKFPDKWIVSMPWNTFDFKGWKMKYPKAKIFHNYILLERKRKGSKIEIPEKFFDY